MFKSKDATGHLSRLSLLLCIALFGFSALGFAQNKKAPAVEYLKGKTTDLGINEADLAGLKVDHVSKGGNGLFEVAYLQQTKDGIAIHNRIINVVFDNSGKVVSHSGKLANNLDRTNIQSAPGIAVIDGLQSALSHLKLGSADGITVLEQKNDSERSGLLSKGDVSMEDIPFRLVYQDLGKEGLKLAWEYVIYEKSTLHWWQIRIDAMTGAYLDKNDWVTNCTVDHSITDGRNHIHGPACADEYVPSPLVPFGYNVYPIPVESPSHGVRSNEINPASPNASPFGWHDTNASPGAEYTITRGNNVYASEDQNADNIPGFSPDGGANLDFDFPINFANAPSTYQSAAITNLFYWNNIIHDVLYEYGFDEASGNFQENNYGNGGAGNDFVFADALDGSGTNNANFGTPPDGANPRMQMFVWTITTPSTTSDLDNGVIIHEYGHGVSNRLTGGPNNTSCLFNEEQMGEGWSDYLGLMLTLEPGDFGAQPRGIGTYVLGQPTTGTGIRQYPYSTDMGINPHTYGNVGGVAIPHGVGSIWCAMLWEMTWALIDQYGFDPDIYNGTGGNNIALQLVMDGMKLQACSPGFVDGRDAILLADQINNGGANQCLIWAAFAKRGLGIGADQGSSSSVSDGVADFNEPCFCAPVPGPEGCTDPTACNFDANATCNDLSCTYAGCTNPLACNFDPAAGCDDGSCLLNAATPTLTLTTDCWPGETTWEIIDSNGNTVATSPTYGAETTYTYDACLIPNECYTFNIYDSFGDGLNGTLYGCGTDGNYFMIDDLGNTLFTMGTPNFGFGATHTFCLDGSPPPIPGCNDNTACNFDPLATINDGSCIYAPGGDECSTAIPMVVNGGAVPANNAVTCVDGPEPSCGGLGIRDIWFSFSYTGGDIAIQTTLGTLGDTRMAVYDACGGVQIGCNDDFGSLASRLEFPCTSLNVGQTYYIQVGGYVSQTGGFSVEVSSTGTSGCTDLDACNYDANAICDDGSCTYPQWYIPPPEFLGPAQLACSAPPGYTLADQACAQQVVNNDPWCFGTVWDNICMAAYNCCLGNFGCGDGNACNYDPAACNDLALCVYPGCTDPVACNYNGNAGCDDGSCILPQWYLPNTVGAGPIQFVCTPPPGYYLADQACAQQVVDLDPFCVNNNWDNLCMSAYNCCIGNFGCGDDNACNYDPAACNDPALCVYPGCTDPVACNYNGNAGCDDGSCILPQWYLPNTVGAGPIQFVCTPPPGYFLADQACAQQVVDLDPFCVNTNWDDICQSAYNCCLGVNFGCNDFLACNYDPAACNDPALCVYPGCTDPVACNYNGNAGCDDGSCILPQWYLPNTVGAGPIQFVCTAPPGYFLADQACAQQVVDLDPFCVNTNWDDTCQSSYNCCIGNFGCTDLFACNYDPTACNIPALCVYPGCTDPVACNYNPNAGCDDGSCILPDGCTDPIACNYNASALCDDGSCILPDGCTDPVACNYDGNALCDDGSCILPQWYLPNNIGDGPIQFVCTAPPGYFLADQACAQQVVDLDPFCVNTNWDEICQSAYNCCLGVNFGCTVFFACNYDPAACNDPALCVYPGCNQPTACNYDPNAGCDDGSCTFETVWYQDMDNDGVGSDITVNACTQPAGYVAVTGDCDDFYNLVYPGAPPTQEGIDNDCNGTVDPDELNLCVGDFNNDGFRNSADLLFILGEFGCTSGCQADMNGDGNINTGDVTSFLSIFGVPCP